MARVEVALRSPISFRRSLPEPHELLVVPPETVGIEFEERLFVWHAFPPSEGPYLGKEDFGPSVTVVVVNHDDAGLASDDLERFVSALAFWLHQPAEGVSYGASGETDPFHPAI